MSVKKLKNQNILVIGGTGSLGRALIGRLAFDNHLSIMSRDEAKHWTIKNSLNLNSKVDFYVGDIRDYDRVTEVILRSEPNILIIASALKQVDTCEIAPSESVKTNLLGVQNVCNSIYSNLNKINNLNTVLLVSTDKACAPTNVYGMCKAISERIITGSAHLQSRVKFVAVRYGNVLESRGSIIPLFKYQAENHPALTVTHKEMTRFTMTLNESIDLIENTILSGSTGEIWIPKIPSMKILELAEIFAEKFSKDILITGIRPGEKLHEDLISVPESMRTRDTKINFIIEPSLMTRSNENEFFSYNSSMNNLTKNELNQYLINLGIFERKLNDFIGREIEEIRST
jgi:UDP-N-acetylglucosamine 4,6-dehydratase